MLFLWINSISVLRILHLNCPKTSKCSYFPTAWAKLRTWSTCPQSEITKQRNVLSDKTSTKRVGLSLEGSWWKEEKSCLDFHARRDDPVQFLWECIKDDKRQPGTERKEILPVVTRHYDKKLAFNEKKKPYISGLSYCWSKLMEKL